MAATKDKEEKERKELTTITEVGIACFVHVWEPFVFKTGKNKEPQYRMVLVFKEGMSGVGDVKRIVGNAIKKKFGEEAKTLLKKGKLALPWRDASDYEEYGFPFTEDDAIMISVSSRSAPQVVDARARPILKQQDFYAGCEARCSVYAHAFDTDGNKGVTLLLNNVQKAGDGDKLGGGKADATEEFGALEQGEDEDTSDIDDLL